MPYRRLPNTDIARINALEVVVEIKHTGFRDIALSQDLLTAAERQLIVLRNSHDLHRQAVKMWQENNQKYREIIKNLTAYIIDFVKAYNAAIERGEINPDSRVYYRMTDASLPVFNSEEDILDWGRRLSDGEQKRILAGGAPVTNPTIANLNVYYDKFTDLNFNQKTKLGYIQHTKTKLAQAISRTAVTASAGPRGPSPAAPDPREAAPDHLLRPFSSATPFYPLLRSFFSYSEG